MTTSIIKYALDKSGSVIFIDNADNGLSCGCKCAKCGKDMIAVQGEARKKEWHFRHHEETDCLVELHDFIESAGADYWLYGHHHTNIPEFSIGKTKLITNQLGYVRQNEHKLFKNEAVIDI